MKNLLFIAFVGMCVPAFAASSHDGVCSDPFDVVREQLKCGNKTISVPKGSVIISNRRMGNGQVSLGIHASGSQRHISRRIQT